MLCSAVHCGAVCCSVLQCVTDMPQSGRGRFNDISSVNVAVLQCCSACCSALQRVCAAVSHCPAVLQIGMYQDKCMCVYTPKHTHTHLLTNTHMELAAACGM